MATSKEFIESILGALSPLDVRAKAMFGEYGFYCDEKFVALICSDRFFLKPTAATAAMVADMELCPPYTGAKDYVVIEDHSQWDRARFQHLVQATADELPIPKPRSRKQAQRRKA